MSATALRTNITGVCPAAQAWATAELMRRHSPGLWLVLIEEAIHADTLREDIAFFHRPTKAGGHADYVLFPETHSEGRDMRGAFQASSARLAVLSKLRGRRAHAAHYPHLVIVTTPAALLQPVPPPEEFAAREIELRRGQSLAFAGFLEKLREFDYDAEAVCEAPGQYAVRGGIVDLYPLTATQPCRLDFLGDTLEDIRALDPVTQRSGDPIERTVLTAAPKLHTGLAPSHLADHFPPGWNAVLLEPKAVEEAYALAGSPASPPLSLAFAQADRLVGLGDLDLASDLFDAATTEETWDTESLSHHRPSPDASLLAHDRLAADDQARTRFLDQVASWKKSGYTVALVTGKEGEEQRLRELLDEHGSFRKPKPAFLRGQLNEGFRVTFRPGRANPPDEPAQAGIPRPATSDAGVVFVTETEIFGRRRLRRAAPRQTVAGASAVDQLLDFAELADGDLVVHLQHGVAVYRGLAKLATPDGAREVISLEFDDRVTLHVPLTESHLISRYVGLSKVRPQLGRIGTGRWEKTRQAAERATLDLAAELLEIQAKREAQPGHAFASDTVWQREFEAAFPYTETRDQARAIVDVKADMERTRPMDRLLCGDVGYGKTEVAVRAAFKAVMGGRQVAVLVPTTVLAQQHLNTFRERMAGYPVAIEMLSRFRSRKEQRQILDATAQGKIDILIGTHRLIQADVKFKELGLVVIDEEQRFGVKHKEVFKRWRAHVDLLSMSATPIPRTLYLALTGARDLSTIETPPSERLPIQTVVKNYDEKLVVDAIRHEVRRGGQVFYLHNRVLSIGLVARRLRELLPELNIGVGHGRMGEDGLERMMTDFVAGRYHVLVCTTIIESGLDIPNCNTIIIEGADRFGLSQLYQLRGRVGRFRHQAYAYLLLHRHARVVDLARQRLAAIRQHSQLGAGFRIAMRDLELRGAGNLLGAQQSGHIVGVGFELYCQLLRQSVSRLKGEKSAHIIRASVKLDFVYLGEGAEPADTERGATDSYTALRQSERAEDVVDRIPARLPAAFIAEARLRIDFYRRLALADSAVQVKAIGDELRDRFGRFGPEVRTLLLVTEVRVRAEQKGLLSVEADGVRLKCLRNSGRPDDFIQLSHRFPRLTAPTATARLKEILVFLQNLPNP